MKIHLNAKNLPTSTFACGPGQGLPSVRQTMLYKTLFERSHRAPDISTRGLYKEAETNLRTLFSLPADYAVLFFQGGATPAMDAVLWNLTEDSLSGLAFGAFSSRWADEMAKRLGKDVANSVRFAGKDEFFPREKPDCSASLVILTPNETSTGVQIPDSYLEEIWQQRGENTLVAWDCTSCAGGRVLPPAQYDVMLFGMQKCFGTGGGSSVIILSPRAVKRLKQINKRRAVPYSLDLLRAFEYAQKAQTSNTPNTTNIWMFNEACKWMNANGGLPAMEKLCKLHAQYLLGWAAKTDYLVPLIKDEDFRSFTTLTLEITNPRIKDFDVSAALRDTGLANLADGIKKYASVEQNSFRIACFPFVDINGTDEYKKLSTAVDEIVRQMRAAPSF